MKMSNDSWIWHCLNCSLNFFVNNLFPSVYANEKCNAVSEIQSICVEATYQESIWLLGWVQIWFQLEFGH